MQCLSRVHFTCLGLPCYLGSTWVLYQCRQQSSVAWHADFMISWNSILLLPLKIKIVKYSVHIANNTVPLNKWSFLKTAVKFSRNFCLMNFVYMCVRERHTDRDSVVGDWKAGRNRVWRARYVSLWVYVYIDTVTEKWPTNDFQRGFGSEF